MNSGYSHTTKAMDSEQRGKKKGNKHSVLSLRLQNEDHLYKSYMPFLNNGGVFVETKKTYALGQKVVLFLRMPENDDKVKVAAVVAWVTPQNVRGGKKKGVGLEFADKKGVAIGKDMAHMLRYRLSSDEPTYTM